MLETSTTILAKNVDGGVEDVLLDLLARIVVLENSIDVLAGLTHEQAIPSRYTMEYPGGIVAAFVREMP